MLYKFSKTEDMSKLEYKNISFLKELSNLYNFHQRKTPKIWVGTYK